MRRINTVAHVVLGAHSIVAITSDGARHKATLEKLSDTADLAELKIDGLGPDEHNYLQFGNADGLQEGDSIYGLGHPLGYKPTYISPGYYRETKALATHETIQSTEPMATASDQGKKDWLAALVRPIEQSRLHAEEGDSGGPVVDRSGKVVGVIDYGTDDDKSDTYLTSVSDVRALVNDQSNKFQFQYALGATPSLLGFTKDWKDSGSLASQLVSPFPFLKNSVATLGSDRAQFHKSTSWRDSAKYGLAVLSDAAMIAGEVSSPLPLGAGAVPGLIARKLVDYMPTYPLIQGISRSNGDKTPPFRLPVFYPSMDQ